MNDVRTRTVVCCYRGKVVIVIVTPETCRAVVRYNKLCDLCI